MHLTAWEAKRAGGAITVTGRDKDTGQDVKIVGVVKVVPSAMTGRIFPKPCCVAVMRDGARHTLAI